MSALDDAKKLYDNAAGKWGWFRRTLAKHPLTVFWITLGAALLVGFLVGKIA